MVNQFTLSNSSKESVGISNLKVCIVSPLFNPLIGGPSRQAVAMTKQLIKKGVDTVVISRQLSCIRGEIEDVEVHYVSTISSHVYNLTEFSIRNFLIAANFALGAAIKLFKLRERFDIVQFYSASLPLLLCLPLLKMLGKKVVAKTTGGRGGKEAGGLDNFFLKPLLVPIFKYTDKFIAVSDEIMNRLLKEGYSEKVIIKIPNGVDAERFSPSLESRRKQLKDKFGFPQENVFLYSGRIVRGKGLESLMRAMIDVVKINDKILLVLIGSGDLDESLKDMGYELGLEKYINFEGLIENVDEYLNASDIFILPSFSEGMPNSLLEAMACGLPVIASKIGGVVDVVEDGKSGILFEPGDVSGLASAMIKLLNDNELRLKLGAEARKRIVDSFSIDRIADEYIRLYERLSK
ncbi:MAG: glycosyltransferase family 4 protein [Nitrospirae bacterium]|nr:glycosyltransferase family 4 protein [Nitrospirota bacterium]